jgi:hypothetical protein
MHSFTRFEQQNVKIIITELLSNNESHYYIVVVFLFAVCTYKLIIINIIMFLENKSK